MISWLKIELLHSLSGLDFSAPSLAVHPPLSSFTSMRSLSAGKTGMQTRYACFSTGPEASPNDSSESLKGHLQSCTPDGFLHASDSSDMDAHALTTHTHTHKAVIRSFTSGAETNIRTCDNSTFYGLCKTLHFGKQVPRSETKHFAQVLEKAQFLTCSSLNRSTSVFQLHPCLKPQH